MLPCKWRVNYNNNTEDDNEHVAAAAAAAGDDDDDDDDDDICLKVTSNHTNLEPYLHRWRVAESANL